jgi:hypothetical protein
MFRPKVGRDIGFEQFLGLKFNLNLKYFFINWAPLLRSSSNLEELHSHV